MRFTHQEEYGLRCLLQLARSSADTMTIPEIAGREGLTVAYVAKLMRLLRKGGLVDSVRGSAGGYRLSRAPDRVTMSEALAPLGASLFPEDFCREHRGRKRVCVHNTDCSIRALWRTIDIVVQSALTRTTLHDLCCPETSMGPHALAALEAASAPPR